MSARSGPAEVTSNPGARLWITIGALSTNTPLVVSINTVSPLGSSRFAALNLQKSSPFNGAAGKVPSVNFHGFTLPNTPLFKSSAASFVPVFQARFGARPVLLSLPVFGFKYHVCRASTGEIKSGGCTPSPNAAMAWRPHAPIRPSQYPVEPSGRLRSCTRPICGPPVENAPVRSRITVVEPPNGVMESLYATFAGPAWFWNSSTRKYQMCL